MIVETTYTPKPAEGQKPEDVTSRNFQIDYDFGDNLLGMLRVLGAGELIDSLTDKERDSVSAILLSPAGSKVYYNSRARMIVALQGVIRGWMSEDLSDDEIVTKVANWEIPEGAPRAKDPVEKAAAMLDNLSDDDIRRLLEKRGLSA